MTALAIVTGVMLVPGLAAGQTANPSLTATADGVRTDQAARKIALRRIDLSVIVRGALAETEVTAVFANPGTEALEGDFRFALPEGAVVTGYALDVAGTMIDGVLVDRPRAKAIYEERVRGAVDPGLATVGNDGVFHTRVYPVPPRGERRIRLRFVAPLTSAAQSDETWLLPLDIAPRDGWSISVSVAGDGPAPSISWPGRSVGPMARDSAGWRERAEGRAPLSGTLAIGRGALPSALMSRNALGERYVQLSGALPTGQPGRSDSVRIYWDRSRSRARGRHDDELALLRRTLVARAPKRIELVLFNSSGAERRTVSTIDAAINALKAVRYRGASSMAALSRESAPVDRCLLFSNGRPSIDRAASLDAACHLDVVTTAPDADLAWLRRLAVRHGGEAHRLGTDASLVEKALAADTPGVTGVVDAAGRPLEWLALPSRAGRWMVLARASEGGAVTVRIGAETLHVDLPAGTAPASFDGEGQMLASGALADLGAPDRRADYVALSRRYGIASPSLSFLVLESPDDYVDADIAPPASYPATLRNDYDEQRREADEEKAQVRSERLERVIESWTEQVAWWERRFDPRAKPSRRPGQRGEGVLAEPMPVPVPAPTSVPTVAYPTPPMPAMANERSGQDQVSADDNQEIVIVPGRNNAVHIAIDAWQPDRPYLKLLDAAPDAFDTRLAAIEAEHGGVPAFYFDAAAWLAKRGRTADAVEMVLAALDLPSADERTQAIVASRLERYGAIDRAIELRERVAMLESERPQPRRLLALALARRAKLRPETAKADLTRAVALLGEVALTPWNDDWEGIDLIALIEANALIPKLRALGGDTSLDPRLIKHLDVDLRVVADWDTNATDLDLWVDEPNGERAIYSNPRTAIGGRLSNDMTSGYGPEEYLLRRAAAGEYGVKVDTYASDRIDPNGASVVTVRLIRNFGRPDESEQSVDIELMGDDDGEKQVGTITVGPR